MSDDKPPASVSVAEAFRITIQILKDTQAEVDQLKAENERLKELVERDIGSSAFDDIAKERDAMKLAYDSVEALALKAQEELERLRTQYDERGLAMRETGDVVRSLYEPQIEKLTAEVERLESERDMHLEVATRLTVEAETLRSALTEAKAALDRIAIENTLNLSHLSKGQLEQIIHDKSEQAKAALEKIKHTEGK